MRGYPSSVTPLLLISLMLAGGCASMHHGRSQPVIVASDPPGARILVGGEPAGVTPNLVMIKRRGVAITLDKDGFLPQAIEVPRSASGWLLGDVALGALFLAAGPYVLGLTLGLDLATGAASELPDEVTATLEPARAGAKPASRNPEGAHGHRVIHGRHGGR